MPMPMTLHHDLDLNSGHGVSTGRGFTPRAYPYVGHTLRAHGAVDVHTAL
jgi:hypothetical protein